MGSTPALRRTSRPRSGERSRVTSLSLMIKPVSAACNLRCSYCFYRDIADQRQAGSFSPMRFETLDLLVRRALDYADDTCVFSFQGGEPTLIGLDYFRELIKLQDACNTRHVRILNTIQSNGCDFDDQWAAFFHDQHFLVGLSLDGPAEIHNLNRLDSRQNGSFNRVTAAARLLTRHRADFNILSVVTSRSSRSAEKIYRFFKSQGFNFLQFIPCLEPLDGRPGAGSFRPSPEQYGQFLCRLLDLWHQDLVDGRYISIRYFDNLVQMINGRQAESCVLGGACSLNMVVEANGNVYPCDFYCLDSWCLGNIGEASFADLLQSEKAQRFVAESLPLPAACQDCEYYPFCRNGCRRVREPGQSNQADAGRFYYCQSYRQFFKYGLAKLHQVAALIR
jgi:uncharacterized protein